MKKVLISYGDESYYKSLDLLKYTALDIGKVDHVTIYAREWLVEQDFKNSKKW